MYNVLKLLGRIVETLIIIVIFLAVLGLLSECKAAEASTSYSAKQAPNYIGKALYKEWDLDNALKRLGNKYISKDVQPYIWYTGTLLKITTEKQITLKWEF